MINVLIQYFNRENSGEDITDFVSILSILSRCLLRGMVYNFTQVQMSDNFQVLTGKSIVWSDI